MEKYEEAGYSNPLFSKQTAFLVQQIQAFSDAEMACKLHLPPTQTDKIMAAYRTFGCESNHALFAYTGEAFKYLKQDMTFEIMNKLNERLYIFSGLYGVLRPLDQIHPYRLDLTMSILEGQSLTNYWKEPVNGLLKDEGVILSLASKEFEKILEIPYYRIEFIKADGKKVHTVLAKQMRGSFARYFIEYNIYTIEDVLNAKIKGFEYVETKGNTLYFQQK